MKEIKIGNRIRDRVSGLIGIATARCVYFTGCIQYLLSPDHLDQSGNKINGIWLDENAVEYVDAGIVEHAKTVDEGYSEPPQGQDEEIEDTEVGTSRPSGGGPQENTPTGMAHP